MLFVLSCRNEKKVLPPISDYKDSSSRSHSTADRTLKGLFVVGKNIRSFRSCDDPDKNYFVIDSTDQMVDLYKTMFLNSPAFPYEYVYVEVKGSVKPPSSEMISMGFDSVITVKDVLTFEQKNYRNTCIPYDFWALGNDPSWSLQVSEKEDIIALKDYTNNTVYLFEYFSPRIVNDEIFTYNSNNYANQTSISAVFKKQPCHEGDRNDQYEYSVSVIINGKKYSGCGIKGKRG